MIKLWNTGPNLRWRNKEQQAHLMEVKHQVQLAHVAEELVQELHEQVDGLEISQLVIAHVHAQAEEEASVSPVDDLVVAILRHRAKWQRNNG